MDNVKLTNAIPLIRNVWNATVVRPPILEGIETKRRKRNEKKMAVT
jgi:hypothetical protein